MHLLITDNLGFGKALIDHASDCSLNQPTQRFDGVFSCVLNIPPGLFGDKLIANYSPGVLNIASSDEARRLFYKDFLALETEEQPVAYLFSLFNGVIFSDWMEISHSERFMNKDVGPRIGFVTGVGLPVNYPVLEAIPKLELIREGLVKLNYVGEVLVGITRSFTVSSLLLGHFPGPFAMYCEGNKNKPQEVMEFCFQRVDKAPLYDAIVFANLVTKPTETPIAAPRSAESHIWRFYQGHKELALITVYGKTLAECRKRIWITLENMAGYDRDIQFRTDFGHDREFVLMADKYKELQTR